MKNNIVTASEIGKTAYCPHGHYLSTIHKADRRTLKRLAYGNKMHDALGDRSEKLASTGKIDTLINIMLTLIIVGLGAAIYLHFV